MPAGASPEAADVRRRQARSAKHRRASVTHFMSQNGELASKTILFFSVEGFFVQIQNKHEPRSDAAAPPTALVAVPRVLRGRETNHYFKLKN